MADLTITPTSVTPVDNLRWFGVRGQQVKAEVAIDAGELCTINPSTSGAELLNITVEPTSIYLAMNVAAIGQVVTLLEFGIVNFGALLAQGAFYYASVNPGKIADTLPVGGGTNYSIQAGYAKDTGDFIFQPLLTGILIP